MAKTLIDLNGKRYDQQQYINHVNAKACALIPNRPARIVPPSFEKVCVCGTVMRVTANTRQTKCTNCINGAVLVSAVFQIVRG